MQTGNHVTGRARLDADCLAYAKACLEQGMTYAGTARAVGSCETDIRDALPGYRVPDREAPRVDPVSPFTMCAAILPEANPEQLARVAALALRLLCDLSGPATVRKAWTNIADALPTGRTEVPRDYLEAIVDRVADKYGLSRAQIMSRSHLRVYAWPRQEAYYVMRRETDLSFGQLGRFFGRDHTTIMVGIKRHEARMAQQ